MNGPDMSIVVTLGEFLFRMARDIKVDANTVYDRHNDPSAALTSRATLQFISNNSCW